MAALLRVGTLGRRELADRVAGFFFSKTYHLAGTVLEEHAHENASLVIVLGGGYQETFRGVSEIHSRGTVIVKPPGETHANDFRQSGATCLLVEPEADVLKRIRCHSDIFDRPNCFTHPGAVTMAHLMLSELREPDAATPLMLESAALNLLVRCSRTARRKGSNEIRLTERARAILHEIPLGSATLSTVAAELQVHPVHLARAFKRAFGLTIGAYARRLQVDRAVDLLMHSSRSIGNVAQSAGFYDQSHMARVLRQQIGLSPSEVRKSAGRR